VGAPQPALVRDSNIQRARAPQDLLPAAEHRTLAGADPSEHRFSCRLDSRPGSRSGGCNLPMALRRLVLRGTLPRQEQRSRACAEHLCGHLSMVRTFFRDLQEWDLIPRRFDPIRSFVTPKSVLAKIGPNPRIISDDVWAKLVWAGLNLSTDDLPRRRRGSENSYPAELCRALAITWLFAGLRVNEIVRLRLGCIRWQNNDVAIPGDTATLAGGSVCLLDVPVNKTSAAFTKPVDPIVGETIFAWEKVRPTGMKLPDPKTGEIVDFLFLYRLTVVGKTYFNDVLIPMLCRKAGVPRSDARGNITSHRGRSTIASQLFNAKEPMTLFELQQWLGHSTPAATQHYAKITPTKLAKSYADAALCLPKTPSELKTQRFRAFMRSWCDHDELSFRRPFRFCRLQLSNPYRPAGGDPRASSPTRGFPKERSAALAPPALRPALVGLTLAMVARLAL
jgi:integrase